MVAKLTVIFFIVLCLLAGFVLVLFPWVSFGRVGEWGNNQFLLYISHLLNFPSLQAFVNSGWVKGAVTGLGVFNLCLGFWEIANFKQSVQKLESNQIGE